MKKLFVALGLVSALLIAGCSGQTSVQPKEPIFEVTSEVQYVPGLVVVQRYESDDAEALAQKYYEAQASGCSTNFWSSNGVLDLWTSDNTTCYKKIIAPNIPREKGKWVVVPMSEGDYLGWYLAPMAPSFTDGSPGGADIETGRFDLARYWIEANSLGCAPQMQDQYRFFLTEDCSMQHPWTN